MSQCRWVKSSHLQRKEAGSGSASGAGKLMFNQINLPSVITPDPRTVVTRKQKSQAVLAFYQVITLKTITPTNNFMLIILLFFFIALWYIIYPKYNLVFCMFLNLSKSYWMCFLSLASSLQLLVATVCSPSCVICHVVIHLFCC